MQKSKKISIVIKNTIESEGTLMHKAERPSNYFFTHYQAEQIKKGVICVQFFVRNLPDLTQLGPFSRLNIFINTPVLVTVIW